MSFVGGVFVHCDGLEERAVDLLDHVPFSIQRLHVSVAIEGWNGEFVVRTDANPLGGRLDLDRPPYLKNDVHYLREKRERKGKRNRFNTPLGFPDDM